MVVVIRPEWSHPPRCGYRVVVSEIRLAARVRPHCLARICRKPVDTATSAGVDVSSARTSVDVRLSRADGQHSSENIPASRIGL